MELGNVLAVWEQQVGELWIEREVLRNMLLIEGTSDDLIVRALKEAKTDSGLWRRAREFYSTRFLFPH
jgi:hypothetical protein